MLLRQIVYLVALADQGHFARAAETCAVSQPALSSGIARLEQELGMRLVRRGRNYEGLTDQGQRVLGWARHMLASHRAMRQEAGLAGTVRIGAIPTAMPVVPFITAGVPGAHPAIGLTVLSLPADEIARRLDRCDLDIGLSFLDERVLAGLDVHLLYCERYVLVARDPVLLGGARRWTGPRPPNCPCACSPQICRAARSSMPPFARPACGRASRSKPIRSSRCTPRYVFRTCARWCPTACSAWSNCARNWPSPRWPAAVARDRPGAAARATPSPPGRRRCTWIGAGRATAGALRCLDKHDVLIDSASLLDRCGSRGDHGCTVKHDRARRAAASIQ